MNSRPTTSLLNLNDAADWQIPISDEFRTTIIKEGSEKFQHKEGPFTATVRSGDKTKGCQRTLASSWFYVTLPSGEKYLRKWMVYSPSKNMLYCFCCRLFCTSTNTGINKFISGFQDWWKLNPKLHNHESSPEHVSNLEKWKTLAVHLERNKTIDAQEQHLLNTEIKKWRSLLHRLLDITLFLAQQNLAFRGHRETISSDNQGNFLELVKLMSKYDPVLKEHCLKIEQSGKVSYLSKDIQNEFIALLGGTVKQKLIDDIKKSKYFGILFDSTPDISHQDQMSCIVRYVHIEGNTFEVKESFLGFFLMSGKTAEDMTRDILHQLDQNGLDIQNCTAQGYDNAASMAGIHGGVQKKIKDINPKVLFTPCANHSLNLCGVHSFGCVPSSVTCFAILEQLYSFFSVSTQRWDLLTHKVGKTVKRLCETRWSAHYDAVSVARNNIKQLINLLEEMSQTENLNTRSAASVLVNSICDFTFLSFLDFWSTILEEINDTQKYIQTKGLTLDKLILKFKTLQLFLINERENVVEKSVTFSTEICNDMGIDIQKRGRRKIKKLLPGEDARGQDLTLQEEVRRCMYECVDRFTVELKERFAAISSIADTFSIVEPNLIFKGSDVELASAADKLRSVYEFFSKEQLIAEIKRLNRHIVAADIKGETWNAKTFLEFILKWDFKESVPNMCVVFQIFLTVCISVASCERSFSKLKLIKDYLRSNMSQARLSSLAILSIERTSARNLDFDIVVDKFAATKARKKNF